MPRSLSHMHGGFGLFADHCLDMIDRSNGARRLGPSGKKDLCNACGLRYARSKQKKDGNTQPKRRREKDVPLTPAPMPVPVPGGVSSNLQQPGHSHLSTSASTSSSSVPPSWPNAPHENRDQKRMRSETFTTVSHSPSPPHSEGHGQPESYPEAYGARYGQAAYPQGYTNGYSVDYNRMPGPVPSYVTPELPSNDRTFTGH
ncbi:PAS domain [Rhizoctonia solani]|uniref:PAS domain n=1 Tax=Rhizoctonia solani TaxID=456999 RepID=A0A8H7M5I6_9AGAM|nr:PAS domain [Rhizoctonia solani]